MASPAPIETVQPRWDDLTDLVGSASDQLLLMMPFYSEGGIERVLDSLPRTAFVTVATRLSPADWATGVANPEALRAFLELIGDRQSLADVRRLHAKAYFANEDFGLVGSANLTANGFGGNIELVVRLRGAAAAEAIATARSIARTGTPVNLDQLATWIDGSRAVVDRARQLQSDAAAELEPVQRELDAMLGHGSGGRPLPALGQSELDAFLSWVRRRQELPGAEMVLRRHDNADGQNLQGHVKQSFFAAARFFADHPELVRHLAGGLDDLDPSGLYQLDAPTSDAWNDHVDAHALDSGDGWSYGILRGLMPPGLGGTRLNGGGGSSTLKRVLPLVAAYVEATQ